MAYLWLYIPAYSPCKFFHLDISSIMLISLTDVVMSLPIKLARVAIYSIVSFILKSGREFYILGLLWCTSVEFYSFLNILIQQMFIECLLCFWCLGCRSEPNRQRCLLLLSGHPSGEGREAKYQEVSDVVLSGDSCYESKEGWGACRWASGGKFTQGSK